jgi:hypothetical protein
MKLFKNSTLIVLGLIIAITVIGCSKTYLRGFSPQSHFDYPNSNVIPLGKVVGEASRSAIFGMPDDDSSLQKEAIHNALNSKSEADILINYMVFDKRTDLLFIHTLSRRVEGTAAKMRIGKQKLQQLKKEVYKDENSK